MQPQYSGALDRVCEWCGKHFDVLPCRIRQGRGRFCGHPCSRAGQRRAAQKAGPIEDRLWQKVNKDGPTPSHAPESGPCWLWLGRLNKNGYGLFDTDRPELAHRVVWRQVRGSLSDDLALRHVVCRVRRCVNPDHTLPGTHADNMADMAADGVRKGELHHLAALTDDAVREIRSLAASGVLQREIASRFGISVSSVSAIVRRQNWGHI